LLIILDRDGVINEDSPDFIKSPEEWRAIPGSLEAIAVLNRQGHTVVVASNQSGISRAYFSLPVLLAIHLKMQTELAKLGGHLDGVYVCPHRDEDHCPCRKPNPGMLLQIAKDFKVDLAKDGLLIGDSVRDILAAQAAGCRAVLVETGKQPPDHSPVEGLAKAPVYKNLSVWAAGAYYRTGT